jgi:hypothetical protein
MVALPFLSNYDCGGLAFAAVEILGKVRPAAKF